MVVMVKSRVLHVFKYLLEHSDEGHPATVEVSCSETKPDKSPRTISEYVYKMQKENYRFPNNETCGIDIFLKNNYKNRYEYFSEMLMF